MDLSSINPITNTNPLYSHFIHVTIYVKSKSICNVLRISSEESYGTSYKIELQVAVRNSCDSVSIAVSIFSIYKSLPTERGSTSYRIGNQAAVKSTYASAGIVVLTSAETNFHLDRVYIW
jgi:hypothetical protein